MWQPAPLLFPDAEELFVDAYGALLPWHDETDVKVSNFVPSVRPPRLLVVNRDGGQIVGTRDRVRLRARLFDRSQRAVSDLARKVAAITPLLVSDGVVTRVEHLSGPLDVTENASAPQRYLLFEFDLRPIQQL